MLSLEAEAMQNAESTSPIGFVLDLNTHFTAVPHSLVVKYVKVTYLPQVMPHVKFYQPLDDPTTFIRILDLLPDSGDQPIRAELRHVRLSDRPAYCAVSYTWAYRSMSNGSG